MASDQTSDIGSAAAEDGVKDPLLSLRHPSLSTRCPSGAPHALSEHPPRLPGESHSKQSVFVVVFENKLMSDWLESRMIGGPTCLSRQCTTTAIAKAALFQKPRSPEESSDTPVCGPALTRPAVWDEAAYANADGLFLEGT
ncbi:unnamed protein product [Gadus morhua 'NCC']